MGLIVKTRSGSVRVYGALLRVYPQAFRDHYGAAMTQTFDDMLTHEHSAIGRLRIWAITVVDVPFSAAKEHITNGGIIMNRTFKLLLSSALVAILIVGAGSWWFGNLHARQSVGIERVGVAQLANAMQTDNFYSAYGDAVVLFNGKVSGVTSGTGATLVTFATNRPYNVACQFPKPISVKTGQTLSVAAPAGSADREAHGVLLHNCIEN